MQFGLIAKLLGGITVIAWLAHVRSKQNCPAVIKALIGFAVAAVQSSIFYAWGIKDEIMLWQVSLLAAPLGVSELVLALIYKPSHA
jgi:hypothetical protein